MRELQLLIKPVSSACDLDCTYCFYKDEAANRAVGDHGIMERFSEAFRLISSGS